MTEAEGSEDSRMAWIARLPLQHVAVFFASTGTFAAGIILGWNSFGGWMLRASVGWEVSDADLVIGIVAAGACLGSILLILILMTCQQRRSRIISYVYVAFLIVGWASVYTADKWNQYTMLLLGRSLVGVGVGMYTTILPVFIGEIANPKIRDRLLYFTHMTLSCGVIVSYGLVDIEAEDLSYYNIYCALTCLPALLCGIGMHVNPVESMINGREEEARKALIFYDFQMDESGVDRRMEELRELLRKDRQLKSSNNRQFWTLLALTISHHLSGAITVQFNALTLLDFAGSGEVLTSAELSLVCSTCQLIASLFGFLLVDTFGRRILLTLSATMMALTMGFLGWTMNAMQDGDPVFPWLAPTFVAAFYASYGLGFGPLISAMLADSFPIKMRVMGASIVGASGWLASLLLNLHLSSLLESIGVAKLLWMFVGFSLLGGLLSCSLVRETRGKSLLDLQRQFLNG